MADNGAWQDGVDIAGKSKYGHKNRDKNNQDQQQAPKKKSGGGLFSKLMHVAFPISNLHKGGTVKKTGVYKLKKGEKVLTAAQQKAHGIKKTTKKSHSKRVTKR